MHKFLVVLGFGIFLAACQSGGAGVGSSVYDDAVSRAETTLSNPPSNAETTKAATGQSDAADADLGHYDTTISDLAPGQRPSGESDEAGLWLVSDKSEDNTRVAANRIHDKALNEYVSGIVCQLAGQYCKDVRTYIMRVPAFNANMAPNGKMEVWSGLLLRVQNEAQLATVIGHEIGHYLRRHSIQQFRSRKNAAEFLAFLSLGAAFGGISPDVVYSASTLMTALQFKYGRDYEREADGYGVVILKNAGYDPRESWKVWDRIIKAEEKAEASGDQDVFGSYTSFFSTHPPEEERRDQLKFYGNKLKTENPDADRVARERYLKVILPLRASFLRDELRMARYDQTEALLDQLISDGANVAELYFFKGELYRLRNKESDARLAMNHYQRAIAADPSLLPKDAYRSIALTHLKLGQAQKANEAFRRYLADNPNAEDKAIIEDMIN